MDYVVRYRHAADRLQKTENVMEKYKKKLQEGADLRSHVKVGYFCYGLEHAPTFCLVFGEAERGSRR